MYQGQLRRLARRILLDWPAPHKKTAAQIQAIRKLMALMGKVPRLRLDVGKSQPHEKEVNLLRGLPRLLYLYRKHLPENQVLVTFRHLLENHGKAAFSFDMGDAENLLPGDIIDLQSLGLNLADPVHAVLVYDLVGQEVFFPSIAEVMASGELDCLSLWGKDAVDPDIEANVGGVLARRAMFPAYLRAMFESGVHPDLLHVSSTGWGWDEMLGEETPEEPICGWPLNAMGKEKVEESHQTLLQELVCQCLVLGGYSAHPGFVDGGDTERVEEKALLCLGFGADPDFSPEWSHYPPPRVILERGLERLEAGDYPQSGLAARRLKIRMDDLRLAHTLEKDASRIGKEEAFAEKNKNACPATRRKRL
jgi:hypothetical protein